MGKAQITIVREIVADCDGDHSYLEQKGWEKRLAAFRNGDFGFCGVRAKAEIRVPYGQDWIISHMTSPGLWSIKDDSGAEYFEEVFQEEKKTLLEMLASLHEFEIVE